MSVVYLSTSDNPFHPGREYKSWHDFDMQRGYFTAEYLNRVYEMHLQRSNKHSNANEHDEIDENVLERSVDEIIALNEQMNITLPADSNERSSIKYVKIVE